MILSDPPSPAEASGHTTGPRKGFAQAGNRCPSPIGVEDMLFGIMRYLSSQAGVRLSMKAPMPSSASRASMFSTMTLEAYA